MPPEESGNVQAISRNRPPPPLPFSKQLAGVSLVEGNPSVRSPPSCPRNPPTRG